MTEQGAERSVLEGAVSSLIFQNEENGYTILRLDVGEEEMTVVGSMPGVSPGEYLTVQGQWVRHATYGVQFRADVVERRLPQGMKEIYHYLASGAVKGVGKATARLLIEEFGEDALRVMEEEPEKLTRLRGVSPKRARSISEAFRKQMGMRRLLEFLSEHQLPMELSSRLFRAYGDVALEVVCSNPYVLAAGEFGVDFSQADALALSLGVAADDPQRLEAGLLFEPTTTGTTVTPSSPPRSWWGPPPSCWSAGRNSWRSGWRPWPSGARWTWTRWRDRRRSISPLCMRRRPILPSGWAR